jgi:hypothetical protein
MVERMHSVAARHPFAYVVAIAAASRLHHIEERDPPILSVVPCQ